MRFPLLNPCGSFWNRIEMISSVYSEHVWTAIACSDANRCSPCKYLMLCISWTRVSSSFLWCTAQIILFYCLFSFHKSTMHFHWSHYSVILHTLKHTYGHVTESICNINELKLLQFISWTPNCLSLILLLFLHTILHLYNLNLYIYKYIYVVCYCYSIFNVLYIVICPAIHLSILQKCVILSGFKRPRISESKSWAVNCCFTLCILYRTLQYTVLYIKQ